jgi:hypothetical protein
MRFELMTSSLPRRRSTPELRGPESQSVIKTGAGDEIRTRDPQLGRLMLYQLSYTRPKIIPGAGGRIRTYVGREPAGFTARCH